MKQNNQKKQILRNTIIVVLDTVVFFLSWLFLSDSNFLNSIRYKTYIAIFIVCLVVYLILNSIYDAYAVGKRKVSENAYSLSLSCFISSFCFYFLDTLAFRKFHSLWYLLVALVLQVVTNILWSITCNKIYFEKYKQLDSLVIYKDNYDIIKLNKIPFFDKKYNIKNKIQNPKSYKAIKDELVNYEVVFIIGINATLRNDIIKDCVNNSIETCVIPSMGDVIVSGAQYMDELSIPMLRIERFNPSLLYVITKRLFDIICSLLGIIAFLPFMLIVSLIIVLYDYNSPIYKQKRLTKDGKIFTIYKFRSMKIDAEKDGVARLVSQKDNRITPIGKIIRTIRFDELPQLFNILIGDMSLVGPRPERPEIAKQYEKLYPDFKLRLQVKAGLTGYAQIYGRYDTEPIDKLKMDLFYINRASFMYDVKLCFMTLKTLFMKESTQAIEEGKIIALKENK